MLNKVSKYKKVKLTVSKNKSNKKLRLKVGNKSILVYRKQLKDIIADS